MKREVLERTMRRAAKLAQDGEVEKAEATYEQALRDSEVSSVAEVDFVLGEYAEFLGHVGRHPRAIEFSRLRANLRGQHAPERSEVFVTGLIDLATACRRADENEEAEKALLRAIEIMEEDEPSFRRTLSNALLCLSYHLRESKRHEECLESCERALKLRLEDEEECPPLELARCQMAVARAAIHPGRLARCRELLEAAQPVLEKIGEPEDEPSGLSGLANKADLLDREGRIDEAKVWALRGVERVLAKPDSAKFGLLTRLRRQIGNYCESQGDYAEGDEQRKVSHREHVAQFGEEHLETVGALQICANYLIGRLKYAEAEPLLRKILADSLRLQKADDPDLSRPYNNLAFCLLHLDRLDEAEEMLNLSGLRLAGTDDAVKLAFHDKNLGILRKKQGRAEEAEVHLRKALAVFKSKGPRMSGFVKEIEEWME
ncbi:MAG: tetratricopeptide repeat protein [Verrucomicrobiota bacterium]